MTDATQRLIEAAQDALSIVDEYARQNPCWSCGDLPTYPIGAHATGDFLRTALAAARQEAAAPEVRAAKPVPFPKLADKLIASWNAEWAKDHPPTAPSMPAPAAQGEMLSCGHHKTLAVVSAETGELLYCELCDARSGRADAEAMEAELREQVAQLKAAPAAQGVPDETERLHKIETAAKAVIELWGFTPRWNDRIKQANALYRLAYAIEPAKWTPKLANGLTEAETSATRSVSGLTRPQADSEGSPQPPKETT